MLTAMFSRAQAENHNESPRPACVVPIRTEISPSLFRVYKAGVFRARTHTTLKPRRRLAICFTRALTARFNGSPAGLSMLVDVLWCC